MTLGKFMLDTALGQQPSRQLDEKQTLEALKEVAKEVVPAIQKLREESRKAMEESKNIVLA